MSVLGRRRRGTPDPDLTPLRADLVAPHWLSTPPLDLKGEHATAGSILRRLGHCQHIVVRIPPPPGLAGHILTPCIDLAGRAELVRCGKR